MMMKINNKVIKSLVFFAVLFSFISCTTLNPLYYNRKFNHTNKNDEKHGLWLEYDKENDRIKITRYKDGLKHGLYRIYREDMGLETKGRYKKDIKVGIWKGYYKDCITIIRKYKQGEGVTKKIQNCPF